MSIKQKLEKIEKELEKRGSKDKLIIVLKDERGLEYNGKFYQTLEELRADLKVKNNTILSVAKEVAQKYITVDRDLARIYGIEATSNKVMVLDREEAEIYGIKATV
jgi:transcriptional antiterminator